MKKPKPKHIVGTEMCRALGLDPTRVVKLEFEWTRRQEPTIEVTFVSGVDAVKTLTVGSKTADQVRHVFKSYRLVEME